jgi:polyhydroxyalkanoate synthesis repressor PhaR
MAYVIKRYSNRKLYDTQESRYVTLEEIEEMIRAGREISVVDATSGEDLTSVTLTQIILENERNRRANLPSAFLHQLIKHGEAWQEFVQRTMRSSLEGFVSSQRDMERVFREWSSRSGWGPVPGSPAAAAEAKREADAKRDSGEGKRDGAAADAEADKLRDEVSALRDRLRSLEERLQKRKADAK